jgi:hypothetical protein
MMMRRATNERLDGTTTTDFHEDYKPVDRSIGEKRRDKGPAVRPSVVVPLV